MNWSNVYNFKNSIKHFVDIDAVKMPNDISTFGKTELVWTTPINFRISKNREQCRILKLPNILNFRRAYEEFKNMDKFDNVEAIDPGYKRLSANIETGDFTEGEYEKQLEKDFELLSIYDTMIKVDIKEYYGRIYTHYLGFDIDTENFLTNMNRGQTNGLIMGNYISLYCAELYLSKISNDIKIELSKLNDVECDFSYFSDDFYFFCNKEYVQTIIKVFDTVLERYELERKESWDIWTYETFNNYNMVARYWKKVIAHSNTRFREYTSADEIEVKNNNKLYFINQLVYRSSKLEDEKLKKVFINNFFKTKFFRELDMNRYQIKQYDYHQLCYLFKISPESLLYAIDKLNELTSFDKDKVKKFFCVRYKESLKGLFNDEQLYYYYAIKSLGFDDILREATKLVVNSENQILVSYYIKDNLFNDEEIELLLEKTDEKYWFQSYHLILHREELKNNLETSINTYLMPTRIQDILKDTKREPKEKRYLQFYKENLSNGIMIIREINDVRDNINEYINLKIQEAQANFVDLYGDSSG